MFETNGEAIKNKATKPKETIKRIWNYLQEEKKSIIIVVIMVILSTIISVLSPVLILIAIDEFIAHSQLKSLETLLILLAIIYFLTSLLNYLSGFFMVSVSERALYKLRRDLFNHLEKLSLNFFDKNKKGDLMSRFTNDITVISETLSDVVIQVINSVLILIGVGIIMFVINPLLALTTVITVPLFFFIVLKIGERVGRYYKERQEVLGSLNAYTEERISGIEVVKSYGKEEKAVAKFVEHNNRLKETSIRAQLYSSLIMPTNIAISNITSILLISVGALLTINGKATVGSILAFLTYSKMFNRPVTQLATIYSSIQSALAGAERIFDIIDYPIEVLDAKNAVSLTKIKGDVEFNNVNFGYLEDELVLKNFNLKVKSGEHIALVGPTGAGKTTIINLLSRFYNLNSGTITIDGKDISKVKIADLRKITGIVLQDTHLFKGTVFDNIRYSKMDATLEEVIEACKKSQAHSFIRRLPDGYYSEVEEEGSNFSQGQRQLISIARAILADHEILILDEATSNVDTRTEIAIQKGMEKLMERKTSFVIAHRLSTIERSDKIIVINNGEIVESGNHADLIAKKGFYYNLYKSQFDN
ncbi:MAG: ABC transporter ATP-binding protein [Bacilli bacterium]|nr:ABC transporter ATP-binding protein [Bacilli bacterium]MDD4547187.1 ABC transporter ATP-binding protein [Bacilli bacterium]